MVKKIHSRIMLVFNTEDWWDRGSVISFHLCAFCELHSIQIIVHIIVWQLGLMLPSPFSSRIICCEKHGIYHPRLGIMVRLQTTLPSVLDKTISSPAHLLVVFKREILIKRREPLHKPVHWNEKIGTETRLCSD